MPSADHTAVRPKPEISKNRNLSLLTLGITLVIMLCLLAAGGVFVLSQSHPAEGEDPAVDSGKQISSSGMPYQNLGTMLGLETVTRSLYPDSGASASAAENDISPGSSDIRSGTAPAPTTAAEASAAAPDSSSVSAKTAADPAASAVDASSISANTDADPPASVAGDSSVSVKAAADPDASASAASSVSAKAAADPDASASAASSVSAKAAVDTAASAASTSSVSVKAAADPDASAASTSSVSAKAAENPASAEAGKSSKTAELTPEKAEKDTQAEQDTMAEKETSAKKETKAEKETTAKKEAKTEKETTAKKETKAEKETKKEKEKDKDSKDGDKDKDKDKDKEKKKDADKDEEPVDPGDSLTKAQKLYVAEWENLHEREFPLRTGLHNYNWKYLSYDEMGGLHYRGDPDYTIRRGIDVSEFQGSIDWETVKKAGYDFAFIRAGHRMFESGELMVDNRAIKNLTRAKKAGMDVGVYVFSQAISEEEAREEAKLCLDVIKESGVEITLPVVFDPEIQLDYYARINYISNEQFTDNAIAFCKEIDKAGYTPAIYANCSTETDILDLSRLDDAVIWYADYGMIPESPYRFTFWQYSNTGWVDGIPEATDLNVWFVEK